MDRKKSIGGPIRSFTFTYKPLVYNSDKVHNQRRRVERSNSGISSSSELVDSSIKDIEMLQMRNVSSISNIRSKLGNISIERA